MKKQYGIEADDLISKYQYLSHMNKNHRYVVCTPDKDARSLPGEIFNPQTKVLTTIKPGLGFIELIIKEDAKGKKTYKIYGEGRKWFYTQIVLGDDADDYHPSDFSFVPKMSPYKYYNLFKDLNTDKDCWIMIASLYKQWFGHLNSWTDWEGTTHIGTWIDILQVYVDVVHMQRWEDDKVNVKIILKKYGIIE